MNIDKIWLEYQSALKRFLHSKVNNEADVDDLLQEILIKTHHNMHTINDHRNVKAWLFQVANNTIVDFYRKQGRNKEITHDAPWQLETTNLETGSDNNNSNNNANQVKRDLSECIAPFIDALPTEQAGLLRTIDIDNKSQKAYAEELGISYSTLKSRVQKSRNALKEVFDQCCHFSIDRNGNLYDYEKKKSDNN